MSFEFNSSTFDMENVLTRAVHRVLNNNVYDYSHNSVEKSKVQFHSNVSQGQIRLVADQLCRRIEKRYEKRLSDELARERHQTERKLAQIRNEYRDELDQKRKELQNDKQVMEEQVKEKERTLQHMMDLRELDKQGAISVQRTLLENRYSELKLAQERLDKAAEDFKKRVKADLETVRLEREKLSLKESEVMTASAFNSQTNELKEAREKISDYERQLEKQRLKVSDLQRENSTIKDKKEHTEEELRLAMFRLKDNRPSGESFMISELMSENYRLKEELIKTQVRSSSTNSNELSRLRRDWDHKEQAHLLKIREQKHIIDMMHDKIRNLSSDRTYLQKRVKDLQRDQLYESRKEPKPGRRAKKEKLQKWSEEESFSDSTMSNGSIEIANIKKRISNLDQIAKELDASVEMFSYVNKSRHEAYDESYHEEDSHGYDDFCRNLMKNGVHSSPVKPQKPILPKTEVPRQKLTFEPLELQSNLNERRHSNEQRERRSSNSHLVTTTTIEHQEPQLESDFARMRLRNEELTRKMSSSKEEDIPMVRTAVSPEKPSALADYMSMLSKQKESIASSSKPQMEPTFEEVHFDNAPASDGEIDW